MEAILASAVSLLAVLVGAVITYWFNVQARRLQKVEDAFHEALAAIGTARASMMYVSDTGIASSSMTPSARLELLDELQVSGHRGMAAALLAARVAVARAATYDVALEQYTDLPPPEYLDRSEEIVARIRATLKVRQRRRPLFRLKSRSER